MLYTDVDYTSQTWSSSTYPFAAITGFSNSSNLAISGLFLTVDPSSNWNANLQLATTTTATTGTASIYVAFTSNSTIPLPIVPSLIPLVGTGGTITTVSGRTFHTFLSGGTFSNPSVYPLSIEIMAVGGGGGGGYLTAFDPYYRVGGGGGAGNLIVASTSLTSGSPLSITLGSGGVAGNGDGTSTTVNSSSYSLIALGGGGGGDNTSSGDGNPGGSGGGGAGGGQNYGGLGNQGSNTFPGTTIVNLANNGGRTNLAGGAGGGGAGSVGVDGEETGGGGDGGSGYLYYGNYYAGGGGGIEMEGSGPGGIGGSGGGGDRGFSGTANTGGGGGGGSSQFSTPVPAGAGGSGIVIISYISPLIVPPPFNPTSLSAPLVTWFKGNSGLTASSWTNNGTNGGSATLTGATLTTINGNSAVTFTGGTGYGSYTQNYTGQPHAEFWVIKFNAALTSTPVFLAGSTIGGDSYIQMYNTAGQQYMVLAPFGGTTTSIVTNLFSADQSSLPAVFGEFASATAANNLAYYNGTSLSMSERAVATGYSTGNRTAYLNAYANPSIVPNTQSITWCEVLCYNGELTPSDVKQVVDYLRSKWGTR